MTHGNFPPGRQDGRREPPRAGGFTLIELITVIIILGLLSMFALSRTGSSLGGAELARMAEVRAQLRYLHLRAMKTGQMHGLKCDATNYWAFSGAEPDNATARLDLPGETAALIVLADKGMTMTTFTCFFDGFGIPYNGVTPTKLATAQPITITAGGKSGTLTITPETGHVP